MKVPTRLAFAAINQKFFYNFIYDLTDGEYDYQLSDQSRLLKNIYITGRINMIPIFASRKEGKDTNNTSKLLDTFFNEVKKSLNIRIDFSIADEMNPLKNPLHSFYNITPLEFLQPKV